MATWNETLQDAFGSVVDAGASVMKANSENAARQNNAPTTPAESALSKYQPLVMIGVAGVAVVVLLMLLKRR